MGIIAITDLYILPGSIFINLRFCYNSKKNWQNSQFCQNEMNVITSKVIFIICTYMYVWFIFLIFYQNVHGWQHIHITGLCFFEATTTTTVSTVWLLLLLWHVKALLWESSKKTKPGTNRFLTKIEKHFVPRQNRSNWWGISRTNTLWAANLVEGNNNG